MSDLISRQAAIDAIGNYLKKDGDQLVIADVVDAAVAIGRLPSAQPEIIRCKDCKHFEPLTEDFDYNYCDAWAGGTNEDMFCGFAERRQDADSSGNMSGTQKELKHTETHACDSERTETHDSVSRQAAIDSVCEVCENCEYFKNEKLIQTIKDLPSAQPRWIPVTLKTLPNLNSVVVVCGKKGTWDYGTYRGWSGDIHSWQWKKNTIKHVYWWMYKADALPEPYKEGQE